MANSHDTLSSCTRDSVGLPSNVLFYNANLFHVSGPIVRISPYEVHIKDPEFCVTAFACSQKLDKYGWWYRVFGGPGATISTEGYKLHRIRRSAFQKFLSKHAVRDFIPEILEKLREMEAVLGKFADEGTTINLAKIYRCMACDVVSSYVLPSSFNLLQSDDMGDGFLLSLRYFFQMATYLRYMTFLESTIALLPQSLFGFMLAAPAKTLLSVVKVGNLQMEPPFMKSLLTSKKRLEMDVALATSECHLNGQRPCLLKRINESDLIEVEKNRERLLQEAEQFIIAGSETTGNTLTMVTFHILRNPDTEARLRQELRSANVSFDQSLDITTLESLPFLVCRSDRWTLP